MPLWIFQFLLQELIVTVLVVGGLTGPDGKDALHDTGGERFAVEAPVQPALAGQVTLQRALAHAAVLGRRDRRAVARAIAPTAASAGAGRRGHALLDGTLHPPAARPLLCEESQAVHECVYHAGAVQTRNVLLIVVDVHVAPPFEKQRARGAESRRACIIAVAGASLWPAT